MRGAYNPPPTGRELRTSPRRIGRRCGSQAGRSRDRVMTLILGARFGPHEILSPIGAGGMGEVYRARDTRLGREVAIKVLPDSFATDARRRAQFEHEAHLLASLNHPHIAQVYGLEEAAAERGACVHRRVTISGVRLAGVTPRRGELARESNKRRSRVALHQVRREEGNPSRGHSREVPANRPFDLREGRSAGSPSPSTRRGLLFQAAPSPCLAVSAPNRMAADSSAWPMMERLRMSQALRQTARHRRAGTDTRRVAVQSGAFGADDDGCGASPEGVANLHRCELLGPQAVAGLNWSRCIERQTILSRGGQRAGGKHERQEQEGTNESHFVPPLTAAVGD
jgi:protein kinase-like protein